MSTPLDEGPQPSVINWYFGPTAWDDRSAAMWHAQCPDPYATGHDGEVWLDHQQGAFCSGCRHYEPGQAEQDIPPERAAEIPPQPKPWEEPSPATVTPTQTTGTSLPASPDEAAASSSAAATEEEAAGAASNAPAAPSTATQQPAAREGILTRIKDALEGDEAK